MIYIQRVLFLRASRCLHCGYRQRGGESKRGLRRAVPSGFTTANRFFSASSARRKKAARSFQRTTPLFLCISRVRTDEMILRRFRLRGSWGSSPLWANFLASREEAGVCDEKKEGHRFQKITFIFGLKRKYQISSNFNVKSEKNHISKTSFESTLSRPTDFRCTASREDSKIVSGNQKGKVSTGASSSSRARPRRWRIAERTPVRPDNLHPADTKN